MNKDSAKKNVEMIDELARYVAQTEVIRDLSAPQIKGIAGAETYRDTLIKNYLRIGEISRDNGSILASHYYSVLDYTGDLLKKEISSIRAFSRALYDAYQINNVDGALVYHQAKRLLREANKTNDDDLIIVALDELVSAAYIMMCMTGRLYPADDICLTYYTEGMQAAERLLNYMHKDKFKSLSRESKELVVVNARYIRVVSDIDGIQGTPVQNALLLKRMKAALSIPDDPFYREELPKYDWEYHTIRTLEYICSLTDFGNEKGFAGEDLEFIKSCSKRLKEMYEAQPEEERALHPFQNAMMYYNRNKYLTGDMDLEEYKNSLLELIFSEHYELGGKSISIAVLHAMLEYILVLDRENLTSEEKKNLSLFYSKLIYLMHRTQKKGRLTYQLSFMVFILRNFIEIPGVMDFETICLNLIAALHPPTYVHTLSVAGFTACLTRHLLKKQPELFVGMPGYDSVENVVSGAEEIEDFAYHAAICHDFGKLSIYETILTYGRDLLDEEFKYIKAHPTAGADLLSHFPATKEYVDVALGHHKWYDDKGGYPDGFKLENSAYKTIVCIVACADCLDAATDSVGRSYKQGKSLQDLIQELETQSGSRYAPFVVDLFSDPEVMDEITKMLMQERDKNYIETYNVLKRYDEQEEE